MTEHKIIRNGPIQMDLTINQVCIGGAPVRFTPKEYDLLKFFVENKGQTKTYAEILRHVWPFVRNDGTPNLTVYIYILRQKLKEWHLDQSIKSQLRVGYRMEDLTSRTAV